jgi:acyl carrier protein
MSDAANREELLAALAEWGVQVPPGADEPALISSGALDSLGLVQLAAWVERQVGHPIDATTVDMSEEWDTPAGILRFIQEHRRAGAR